MFGKRFATLALAATAVTGGLLATGSTAAGAMPISTIQSECRAAGGTFYIDYFGGRVSGYACGWRDISGDYYIDYFDRRGNYQFTG
jgi:hypothetical protein